MRKHAHKHTHTLTCAHKLTLTQHAKLSRAAIATSAHTRTAALGGTAEATVPRRRHRRNVARQPDEGARRNCLKLWRDLTESTLSSPTTGCRILIWASSLDALPYGSNLPSPLVPTAESYSERYVLFPSSSAQHPPPFALCRFHRMLAALQTLSRQVYGRAAAAPNGDSGVGPMRTKAAASANTSHSACLPSESSPPSPSTMPNTITWHKAMPRSTLP
eukprot:410622-Pleurochrysis_carterae.AAC.4